MTTIARAGGTVAATWRAMGTRASVRLVGGTAGDLVDARMLVDDLERRWTRFRGDSELSAINAAAGHAVPVSTVTAALVDAAVAWWRATGGRFDPTVLPAVRDAGYVRTFDAGPGPIGPGQPVPGCGGIEVDLGSDTVRVPSGVSLDLGGIGKGAAVDHLVDGLVPVIGGGVVDLGGDLRAWGAPADAGGWPIAVEDPRDGTQVALLWLAAGAVATSTSLCRRWTDGRTVAHHLIDPRTGRPSQGAVVSVTVVAARATGADVLAKAALVAGSVGEATDLLVDHGVAGLLVPEVGTPVAVGDVDALCYPEVAA
jgi:thiamine biosynthesis lipoprotein